MNDSATSPWLEAPSPKYAITAESAPSLATPIAYPVACSVCEPMTIVYRWKLLLFGSQPPLFTPRNMPSRFAGSTPRHQATPCSRYVGKT